MTRYGRYGLERLDGPFEIEIYLDAKSDSSVERLADELGLQILKRLGRGVA